MECPSCTTPMIEETHHGVTVDRCQDCRGFWFDIEEIQRYLNARGTRSGHPIPKDREMMECESGEPRVCPCCDEQALRDGTIRGIDFQRCSWCGGVYLSGTQLESIQSSQTGIRRTHNPVPEGPIELGIDFFKFVAALFFGIITGFE